MVAKRVRRVLRGYTDLTVLGTGRLWTLYRAFDVESSQWVAMRVIPAGAVEEYLLDELTSRINSLQPLTLHPNIATIHRLLRRRDGSVAIVTELCGESLAERLARQGTIPVGTVLKAAGEAAKALGHLHAAGAVHGAVRPSKLLTSRSGGTVVEGVGLADLGIATRTPTTRVSPHRAPEIFEGTAPSPASDVYGLASSLYHLLRGRPAFDAFDGEEPASLILRIVGQPVPPLRAPGVPLAMADLITKAMSKEPGDRPGSVTEFADALRRVETRPGALDATGEFDVPAGRVVRAGFDTNDPRSGRAEEPVGTAPATPPPGSRGDVAADRGRHVLTPLTAGRGAPPVSAGTAPRDLSDTPVTRPRGPRFEGPDDPTEPPAGPVPRATTNPGVTSDAAYRMPEAAPDVPAPQGGEPALHGVPGTLTWAVIGLAAALVVVAALVLGGLA